MTVNKIDCETQKATLTLSRHELRIIRKSLHAASNELDENDMYFLTELRGVDGLLEDKNFARFLSFFRADIEKRKQDRGEKIYGK
ncbi:MAG: hypothetical protein K2H09_01350 [Treponemataceae bacterium]|nr:hypothetical protein [Treponemataceae bacterium]